jgi:hypothetical protein
VIRLIVLTQLYESLDLQQAHLGPLRRLLQRCLRVRKSFGVAAELLFAHCTMTDREAVVRLAE